MININKLWREEGKRCYYCNCDTHIPKKKKNGGIIMKKDSATREHLIPKNQGGKNRRLNIKLACHQCNTLRGSMYAVDWMIIASNPVTLESYIRDKADAKLLKRHRYRERKKIQLKLEEKHGIKLRFLSLNLSDFEEIFGVAA